VFLVRYGLNIYILFRINSVFKGLKSSVPNLYLLHRYTADIENVIVNVSLLLFRVILNIRTENNNTK
jgi:hypothetical protein